MWIVLDGKVYDVTGFDHPGTIEKLLEHSSGEDAREVFISVGHSEKA